MTLRDWEGEQAPLLIWPDNHRAYQVWVRVCGQWRCGPGGFYALDYSVLHQEVQRLRLGDAVADALLDDLRVIELAALEELDSQRET